MVEVVYWVEEAELEGVDTMPDAEEEEAVPLEDGVLTIPDADEDEEPDETL